MALSGEPGFAQLCSCQMQGGGQNYKQQSACRTVQGWQTTTHAITAQ